MNRSLQLFVAVVVVASLASLATLSGRDLPAIDATAITLVLLAVVAGAFPVRLSSLRCELTPAHPLVLCALAAVGPFVALITALAGLVGASLRRISRPIKLIYNVAVMILSTVAAAWAFESLGGHAGSDWSALLPPLAAATVVYFVVDTSLVAAAIAMEKRSGWYASWRESLSWSVPSFLSGLTFAVVLLVFLSLFGTPGLLLGVPPIWMIVSFYRAHQRAFEQQQRRLTEVEGLNTELERTVNELQSAMAHVKHLQGLLPICMHCKSIRDDDDAWHQIEAYLADHSEARFTHAICDPCRDKYYPAVDCGKSDPSPFKKSG